MFIINLPKQLRTEFLISVLVGFETIFAIYLRLSHDSNWFIRLCFHGWWYETLTNTSFWRRVHLCLPFLFLFLFYSVKWKWESRQSHTYKNTWCASVNAEIECHPHEHVCLTSIMYTEFKPSQSTDWFVCQLERTSTRTDKFKGSVCNQLTVVHSWASKPLHGGFLLPCDAFQTIPAVLYHPINNSKR